MIFRYCFWRTTVRLTPSFIIPILDNRNENDYNKLEARSDSEPKTGWERVKKMYSKTDLDEHSVEITNVVQSAMCGAFIGACLGGFMKSKDAYLYFIENNQATIFKSTLDAKKKLQDYVTVAFAKGAYNWGWRLGAFTGLFTLITTTISVYHGDVSLVDYVVAGSVTGALYKANLGMAAMLVGAGVGAVLSTVGGLIIVGLLKVSGASMDDIRKALHSIKEDRESQYYQAEEKAARIKNDELTKHHDALVGPRAASVGDV